MKQPLSPLAPMVMLHELQQSPSPVLTSSLPLDAHDLAFGSYSGHSSPHSLSPDYYQPESAGVFAPGSPRLDPPAAAAPAVPRRPRSAIDGKRKVNPVLNRANQKRYRDKRKEAAQLKDATIDELTAQCASLTARLAERDAEIQALRGSAVPAQVRKDQTLAILRSAGQLQDLVTAFLADEKSGQPA